MHSLRAIPVQNLFLAAVLLKVGSAFLGWWLSMPWTLGLFVPLGVMAIYIFLGHRRLDRTVSNEKFADSCYYLGFIFTITSIVFSLFDLPSIADRIQEIAVRFGAAMVSTLFGLIVRVYLVSFRPDPGDAIDDAESTLVEAAARLRAQFAAACESMEQFQGQVIAAAATAAHGVAIQSEGIYKQHAQSMADLFAANEARSERATTVTLDALKSASERVNEATLNFARGINDCLKGLSSQSNAFIGKLHEKLDSAALPADLFSARLGPALEELQAASQDVVENIRLATSEISNGAKVLATAFRKIESKANAAEEALGTVTRLTKAQGAIVRNSGPQIDRLERAFDLFPALEESLRLLAAEIKDQRDRVAQIESGIANAVVVAESLPMTIANTVDQALTKQQSHLPLAELTRLTEQLASAVVELALLSRTFRSTATLDETALGAEKERPSDSATDRVVEAAAQENVLVRADSPVESEAALPPPTSLHRPEGPGERSTGFRGGE